VQQVQILQDPKAAAQGVTSADEANKDGKKDDPNKQDSAQYNINICAQKLYHIQDLFSKNQLKQLTYTFHPEQLELSLNGKLKKQYNKWRNQKPKFLAKIYLNDDVKIFHIDKSQKREQIDEDVQKMKALGISPELYKDNTDGLTFNALEFVINTYKANLQTSNEQ